MPRGTSKINSLYATLRSDDSDCLDLASAIELLKDVDKRLAKLATARPGGGDQPVSKSERKTL